MRLRYYQQDAIDSIFTEWNVGHNRTLLVLPTGAGKTVVFAKVVEQSVKCHGERVMILAHRGELLEQAKDKIYRISGIECGVEKAEQTCLDGDYSIVVASMQSLANESRLERFPTDYFDTIVIDEAHHVLSDSYQRILNHFSKAKLLGVTATPDRADMKNLGSVFDSLAYEYTLPQAIEDGYLVPIKALQIPLQIDLKNVKTSCGDFQDKDLGNALDPYLEQIAKEMLPYVKTRKTIVFLPLIDTSKKFVSILQSNGVRAVEVNGNSPDRAEILQDFEDGKYQVLCNSMLLTEGYDCPSIECVVMLRPTKVRSLYMQAIGRGTRICEGKKDLLILDFLWQTEKINLCHPTSLICKDQEVELKATELLEQTTDITDIEQLIEEATSSVLEERENALAEELKRQRRKKKQLVDPLQYAFSIRNEDLTNYEPTFGFETDKPTEKQLKAIEKFGVSTEGVTTKGMAGMLLDTLFKRSKSNLATPKQIRLLERYDFKNVGTWDKQQASKIIGMLASNRWVLPYYIDAPNYKPEEMLKNEK